jgi:rod shape-determining protein MreC
MEHSAPQFFQRGPTLLTRFIFFCLASLVLLIADSRFHYLEGMRMGVSVLLYPLQRLTDIPGWALNRTTEFFVTQAQLRQENEYLRQQNLTNATSLQTLAALEAENKNLRTMLRLKEIIGRKAVAAEIQRLHPDPFTRRAVIDRGVHDGVRAGLAVVDSIGLVGQITRVYPWQSEVSLVTDRDQAIPIQVQRSGLRGVLFGIGYDGTLELRYMPVSADVQNGDVLVTSGIDGTYPPGLPVAKVTNVERDVAYAFARINCVPLSGVYGALQVMVIEGGEKPPADPFANETRRLSGKQAPKEKP